MCTCRQWRILGGSPGVLDPHPRTKCCFKINNNNQINNNLLFFTVIEMMKMDPDIMVYSLWVLTVIGVLAGLIMAVAAAVFAVINSAITPISALAGVPGLYFWNISASKYMAILLYSNNIIIVFFIFIFSFARFSVFFQLLAGSLWVGQYFQRLQYNVMSKDDRRNKWTSEGNASLGFSFWFVKIKSLKATEK